MTPETRAGKDRKDRSRAARAPSDSESVGADRRPGKRLECAFQVAGGLLAAPAASGSTPMGLGAYVSLVRILRSTSSWLTAGHGRPDSTGPAGATRCNPKASPEAKRHHKESLHAGNLVHPPCPLPNWYMRLHGRTGG